jgi:hypothetical protein
MELKPKQMVMYSRNTSEFKGFATEFKKQMTAELGKEAELVKFNVGHFYLSGFIRTPKGLWYFSWHNGDDRIMYRTAKNETDFTGGSNTYRSFDEPFNF